MKEGTGNVQCVGMWSGCSLYMMCTCLSVGQCASVCLSVCLPACLPACLSSSFPTYCLSFSLQQSCLVGGIRSGSVHVGNSDVIIKVSWCQICLHLVCMCHCCVCNTLAPQWSVVGLFHPKLFVCFLVRHPLQMYIARLPWQGSALMVLGLQGRMTCPSVWHYGLVIIYVSEK